MRRLVLMHTPAHAAGEIARLMKAVREDRMPLDDTGIEQPLDPALKRALLESGGAFEAWSAPQSNGNDAARMTNPAMAPRNASRLDGALRKAGPDKWLVLPSFSGR